MNFAVVLKKHKTTRKYKSEALPLRIQTSGKF